MAQDLEAWRLSVGERMLTRGAGINLALAEHLGGNPGTLDVISAGNVLHKTIRGDIGHMAVSVSWTREDNWHLHNLRITEAYHAGLNDDQLTLLGGLALERPTWERDFTRDANGLLLQPHALVMEMPSFTPEQANFGVAAA